jgi:hypothetical protein
MSAASELCPASRLSAKHEETIVCILEESNLRGAFTLICTRCWEARMNAKARREEWEVE